MQILAKTKDGFLLTATEQEVAHIAGFTYASESNCPKLEAGLELRIHPVYDAMRTAATMIGAQNRGGLLGMAKDIREYADAFDTLANTVKPLAVAAMHSPLVG